MARRERKPRPPKNDEGRMPVMDHLRELRRRIVYALAFVIVGAALGYYLYPHTLAFLSHPYCSIDYHHRFPGTKGKCNLIYTGVLDGFTTRLKVSVISGAVFTAPLWLYQIWAFVTPGLRKNERKYTIWFILASTLLFAAGVVLAYTVLSKGLQVLTAQAGSGTQALLTAPEYISFVTLLLVIFGAAFELPLLVVMANLAGVLSSRILKKSQRVAIFLIFLFAAVATPTTDPFTMCAMAIPMVALFEGAVLFSVVHDRRKARRKEEEREARARENPDDRVASEIDPIPRALNSAPQDSTAAGLPAPSEPAAQNAWSDST